MRDFSGSSQSMPVQYSPRFLVITSSSSRIAVKAQMRVSGQVFQYFKKELDRKKELKSLASCLSSGSSAYRTDLSSGVYQCSAVAAFYFHNLLNHDLLYWRLLWSQIDILWRRTWWRDWLVVVGKDVSEEFFCFFLKMHK